jgi:FkbM family methyltransferase
MPAVSYSQRFEDLYLARCFGTRADGFYIDIGAGHPVFDNVSFAFYLRGWRGITVEPNPDLARLNRAVRPRDHSHQVLVGAAPGEATFYRVNDFHGLSTAVASHAQSALTQFGKSSQACRLPVLTLRQLCEQHAPPAIDFLKVDVEGLEGDVLRGGDWQRFRPKLMVVEALAPYTLAPAWPEWEPLLAQHGYRYVWFDSLNRYYLAAEASALGRHFQDAPETFADAVLFRDVRPALDDETHPDRQLASMLARAAMTRLPLLDRSLLLDLVTLGLPSAELERQATPADVADGWARLFGAAPTSADIAAFPPPAGATVREIYAALVDSDRFRTACGRISAGYAW